MERNQIRQLNWNRRKLLVFTAQNMLQAFFLHNGIGCQIWSKSFIHFTIAVLRKSSQVPQND